MGMSVSFYTHRFRVGMPEILLDSALRLGRPIVRMVRGRDGSRDRGCENPDAEYTDKPFVCRCGLRQLQYARIALARAARRIAEGRARLRFNLSRHAHSPEFAITWSLIKKAS